MGGSDGRVVRLDVPAAETGRRLDRYLASALTGHTRSALGRLIREGRVAIDGVAASKPGVAIDAGMSIEVSFPAPGSKGPEAETIPLVVVYEDEEILVVNKPSGLVVHPGHGRRGGTLVNALLGRGTKLSELGSPDRPGIVHRLDRETSGLLIVAKTDPAHAAMSRAFAGREIRKRYEALVWGHPDPAEGVIEKNIGRSRSNPTNMAIGGRGSREALTRYGTRRVMTSFALLTLQPTTGRTHQLRVHLKSIGHPIVGDARYGGRLWKGVQDPLKSKALRSFDQLALHASGLIFEHPIRGGEIALEAPLPDDFETLLRALGKD